MTFQSLINPYPVVLNLKGTGLNGGSVYVGVANQDPETFPIDVFWDAAGTDPAAQPLATIGGYIMRLGTPAEAFPENERYSLRVRDRFGQQVFYAADVGGPLADFIALLASPDGAGFIGFSHAEAYPQGTVGLRLKRFVYIKDAPYNAVVDGVTEDTAAFQAALDSGADIGLARGTMLIANVTATSAGQTVFGSRACTIKRKAGTSGALIDITGARQVWTGFDIDGNSANVTYAYEIREIRVRAADVEVSNLRITNAASFPIYGSKGAVRFKIKDNYIENCGDFGIFVNDLNGAGADPSAGICENNTVIEFGIQGGGGGVISSVGIGIRSALGGWRVANNYVRNDTSRTNDQLGIECWVNSNNVTVVGNVVDFSAPNSGEFGLSIAGKGSVVASNLVLGSSSYGIELNDRSATCTGNIVRSPGGSGISINLNPGIVDSGDIMTVTGNVIEGTTVATPGSFAGIIVDGALTLDPIALTISGNTIHGLSTGIQCNNTTVGMTISGNTIYNTGSVTSGITVLGSAASITGNSIIRVSTAGTGNMASALNIAGSGHLIAENRLTGNGRMDTGVLVNVGSTAIVVQGNFMTGCTNSVFSNSTGTDVVVTDNTSSGGMALNPANRADRNFNTSNGSYTSQNMNGWRGTGTAAQVIAFTNPTVGDRAFATDANSTTFSAALVGGGANGVPVSYNGTGWRIG